jgi:hypothetical protein
MADDQAHRLATLLRKTAQEVEAGDVAGIFLVTAGNATKTLYSVPPEGVGAMAMIGMVHMLLGQMEGSLAVGPQSPSEAAEEPQIVRPRVDPRGVIERLRGRK